MSETGRYRILLVDDMEENLVALEAVLSPLGHHLVRARSGEQALKALLRQDFALVLLDVLMPGMDGFETAANIKKLDQTKNVPIIFLTGTEAGQDYAYRGYALGAADFLTKPIDPWLLRTKVGVFLDLHLKNLQLAAQTKQLHQELHHRQAPARTPPSPEDTGQPVAEDRLADVGERLTGLEELLRDRKEAPMSVLADRIAELERAVAALRPSAPSPADHRDSGDRLTP